MGLRDGFQWGNKKTAFKLLLILLVAVLFILYAATGDISHTMSLPQHAVSKVSAEKV